MNGRVPTYPDLEGKVAVVTGGSGGIGAATCHLLAANGAKVAVNGRDGAKVEAAVEAIRVEGGKAVGTPADCTDLAAIERMRCAVEDDLGPADLLLAFAGGDGTRPGPTAEITAGGWHSGVDGSLTATFLTLKSFLPGMDEALLARLFGLNLEEYREIKDRFDANARDATLELLEDASFAELVDRLPFRAGETVVGVGDSITDDLQSWLEVLRHLLAERRPGDGIRVVNAGLSAHTTAMVLRRFIPGVISMEPDWILCLLGGNDATRVGPEPNKPQASIEETARNLEAMRHLASTQTQVSWVWITPPTYVEERAASFPPLKMGQSQFLNKDVVAIGDFVREQEEPVVDIQKVFGTPADPDLQGSDGVHPSLEGQKVIARAFVERLTENVGDGAGNT